MRVVRTVAIAILQRDGRAGVPSSVQGELRARGTTTEVRIGRATAGKIPRRVGSGRKAESVPHLVSDHAKKDSLHLHRVHVILIQLYLTDDRKGVTSANRAYPAQRKRSKRSVDFPDRNEDQRIVVGFVQLGRTGKAGIRRIVEAKVSKVL